jgi:MFS transporter, MCT family, solute carrier family 16 (monocarboxylic acid transporters), member 10
MLIIFAIMFGFFSGIVVALLPTVVSQISPDERLGARMGAFYSLVAVATVAGTPIGGALIKQNTMEGYHGVILYAVSTDEVYERRWTDRFH